MLFGLGVEQDANGHRHGAQPTEEGDGVAKENHRDPDQERPLHRVGHAATIVQSGRVKQRVKHGNTVCLRWQSNNCSQRKGEQYSESS